MEFSARKSCVKKRIEISDEPARGGDQGDVLGSVHRERLSDGFTVGLSARWSKLLHNLLGGTQAIDRSTDDAAGVTSPFPHRKQAGNAGRVPRIPLAADAHWRTPTHFRADQGGIPQKIASPLS